MHHLGMDSERNSIATRADQAGVAVTSWRRSAKQYQSLAGWPWSQDLLVIVLCALYAHACMSNNCSCHALVSDHYSLIDADQGQGLRQSQVTVISGLTPAAVLLLV